MLSLLEVFAPEEVKAGVFDNAYTFYQTYGSEMAFQSGSAKQGEIYYATKAKKDTTSGVRYQTIGWKVSIYNSAGTLVNVLYYQLGGSNMTSVNSQVVSGYEYCLYKVTLSNMKSRMSQAGLNALNAANCEIIFDACITTKINGVIKGGMTDNGPSWGNVYTTYNGIVNAQEWSSTTKETLKTYYNKDVEGLFYNVTLAKGTGIKQVSGGGRYCFGTTVTIKAETSEGYHFTGWTGSSASANANYSFVLYNSNVSYTANAAENTYNIAFHGNGGTGNVPTQTVKYSGKLTLPASGFSMAGSTMSGWNTEQNAKSYKYAKGQQVDVRTLVHALQLQNTNNATIHLYASWDYGPMIETEAIYVSLADAKSGRITENWLATHAAANDVEDGKIPYGKNTFTSFLLVDYQATDFTKFTKEGYVTETFCAVDSAGNSTRKRIKVYIIDTSVHQAGSITGNLRFISKKYLKDADGNLISEANGGLAADSIWRLDEEYRGVLEKLFQ